MARHPQFTAFARLLHWAMAALLLAMLLVGIGMVGSLENYGRLVAIHKPLGMVILVLVAVRLVYRLVQPPPPLPRAMPGWQRFFAHASHVLLYLLMFALPLVGWGMLSAAGYPIVLYGAWQLPSILPLDVMLYAWLRCAHTVLAFLLFFLFLAHLGAALLHGLVFRDGVLQSMLPWRSRAERPTVHP